MRISGFVTAFALIPSQVSAATPIHLAPSSPWVVDYAENSCRLLRRFGEGKDITTLAFESESPGHVDMLVVGAPLSTGADEASAAFLPLRSKPIRGDVTETADRKIPSILFNYVDLLPDDFAAAEEKREEQRKKDPGYRPGYRSLAERAELRAQRNAFATGTDAVEIDARHGHPVILDTGPLGSAIMRFDQCSRDSLRDWGIDPDLEDRIVRPVSADVVKWFSSDDYPKDMLRLGEESTVKVRVLVDATGRVTKCTSISHFNEPEFNRITCAKFIQRVHFKPAELADGTKVPSYYVNKVVFRIAY